MNGIYKATVKEALVIPAGQYLVEIVNGSIVLYHQEAKVTTEGKARKPKGVTGIKVVKAGSE